MLKAEIAMIIMFRAVLGKGKVYMGNRVSDTLLSCGNDYLYMTIQIMDRARKGLLVLIPNKLKVAS